uniref:Glycosyl transferase 64 domain-containing protein n=1 Tax=Plectus sambesii TaxID=2011161 RepID=A0A914V221_9BILA
IVLDRLEGDNGRHAAVWNDGANALLQVASFSPDLKDYPIFMSSTNDVNFTAIIFCSDSATSHMLKLVATLSTMRSCRAIVLLWVSQRTQPKLLKHRKPSAPPITIIDIPFGNRSELFVPRPEIVTTAVFTIDDRVHLNADEIEFALQSWRWFPSRLVGYMGRSHVYRNERWSYSSQPLNHYSLILPDAALFHRYYLSLYPLWLSPVAAEEAARTPECHDLLFNALLSEYTSRPPILLGNRPFPTALKANSSSVRAGCFERLLTTSWHGEPPFLKSRARLDPVLFLDNVSNFRKKFRQMEASGGA